MRRLLLLFVGAALLVGGALSVLNLEQLGRQLAGAHVGIFVLGLIATLAALVCWSETKRQLFVAAGEPLPHGRAFVAYGAGVFGKQVLPVGNAGGPAIMALAFNREVRLGYGRSLAVIIVAKFLGLVTSLVIAGIGIAGLLLFRSSVSDLRWLGVGVVLISAALAALTVVVWYWRRHLRLAATGTARLLAPLVGTVSRSAAERLHPERVDDALLRYYETVKTVTRDRRAVLSAFALSQLGWVFFALPMYTGALALDVDLPLELALFIVPAAGLAAMIPIPGGLGGVEAMLVGLIVSLTAVHLTPAGAVVILFRLCSFWFLVFICGIAALLAAVNVHELLAPSEMSPADTEMDGHSE